LHFRTRTDHARVADFADAADLSADAELLHLESDFPRDQRRLGKLGQTRAHRQRSRAGVRGMTLGEEIFVTFLQVRPIIVRRSKAHRNMNITELIAKLQDVQHQHGDIHVSGIAGHGHPELTVESVTYEPPGPLESANPANNQERLPERVLIAWKIAS